VSNHALAIMRSPRCASGQKLLLDSGTFSRTNRVDRTQGPIVRGCDLTFLVIFPLDMY
jgi:hypothetical protein